MVARRDRTGEIGYNNFGSKMIITRYENARDLDVYFPEYDWTFKQVYYSNFKKGKIKCPYEPRYFGVGYLGEGKYKIVENGKHNKYYYIWRNMLQRCYDIKFHERYPTYKDCEVEDYFLNFQNMCKWLDENYYEIEGETMCLDKDILHKGNKIYSRDTCIFVPNRINTLFVKRDNDRGNSPIGVYPVPSGNYQVHAHNKDGGRDYLGTYPTKEEAFRVYKENKEKVIKEVIDSYEGKIPEPFYSKLRKTMYNYKVEIDD